MSTNRKKYNIYLVLVLVLVYQKIFLAQESWESLKSPVNKDLVSIYFVDSLYGWATGISGTIIHTTNGGNDWTIQDSQTENNVEDIFFLNRNVGWVIYSEVLNFPYGTYTLRTTNSGENWVRSNDPLENIFGKCIFFLDSLNGWMGGISFPIVRTTDGGLTWIEAEIDSSGFRNLPVYDIEFYNSKFGYASGGRFDCCGVVWWTTNGGDLWHAIDTPYVAPEPIYQIYPYDSINVLGVGGDFESTGFGVGMIHSTNGGGSWNFEYIGIRGVAWDIDFRNEYEAWAPLGGEQKLIYSLDSGLSWTTESTPDSSMIFKITFPDSLHGFGVGLNGAIIKYKPNLINIVNKDRLLADGFLLEQNYPNPFNPTTTINYSIPEDGFVKLAVYNLLGEVVATLVDGFQKAGAYDITFFASGLASGVYVYKIGAANFSSSKKLVLMK